MSKHALPRDRLACRLARVALSAAFATLQLWASFVLGWGFLGTGLAVIAGWNIGLVCIGLASLRDAAPWGVGGVPR